MIGSINKEFLKSKAIVSSKSFLYGLTCHFMKIIISIMVIKTDSFRFECKSIKTETQNPQQSVDKHVRRKKSINTNIFPVTLY